jgi:hypothetical protein
MQIKNYFLLPQYAFVIEHKKYYSAAIVEIFINWIAKKKYYKCLFFGAPKGYHSNEKINDFIDEFSSRVDIMNELLNTTH